MLSELTEQPDPLTSTAPPSPQLTSESNDILAHESHPQRTVIDATHAMPSRHPHLVDQTSLSSTPGTESPVQTMTRGRPPSRCAARVKARHPDFHSKRSPASQGRSESVASTGLCLRNPVRTWLVLRHAMRNDDKLEWRDISYCSQ